MKVRFSFERWSKTVKSFPPWEQVSSVLTSWFLLQKSPCYGCTKAKKKCLHFSSCSHFRGPLKIFISDVSLFSALPTHPTHPSFFLLSIAFPLSLASKVLYNDDDSGRRPGSVFAIRTQSRTVYASCNRISCRAGTLSRRQEARKHQRRLARPHPRGRRSLPLVLRRWSLSFVLYILLTSREKTKGYRGNESGRERDLEKWGTSELSLVTFTDIKREEKSIIGFLSETFSSISKCIILEKHPESFNCSHTNG